MSSARMLLLICSAIFSAAAAVEDQRVAIGKQFRRFLIHCLCYIQQHWTESMVIVDIPPVESARGIVILLHVSGLDSPKKKHVLWQRHCPNIMLKLIPKWPNHSNVVLFHLIPHSTIGNEFNVDGLGDKVIDLIRVKLKTPKMMTKHLLYCNSDLETNILTLKDPLFWQ